MSAAVVDRGFHAPGMAVVHRALVDVLELLEARGGKLDAKTDDGFDALHAAAESGQAEYVPWLVERGLDVEARTRSGDSRS